MSVAARMLHPPREDLTEDQMRLRWKAIEIISVFGTALIETPISELRRMANEPLGGSHPNLFQQIWERYHFVPTASFLREIDGEEMPGVWRFIQILDRVWDPQPHEVANDGTVGAIKTKGAVSDPTSIATLAGSET